MNAFFKPYQDTVSPSDQESLSALSLSLKSQSNLTGVSEKIKKLLGEVSSKIDELQKRSYISPATQVTLDQLIKGKQTLESQSQEIDTRLSRLEQDIQRLTPVERQQPYGVRCGGG